MSSPSPAVPVAPVSADGRLLWPVPVGGATCSYPVSAYWIACTTCLLGLLLAKMEIIIIVCIAPFVHGHGSTGRRGGAEGRAGGFFFAFGFSCSALRMTVDPCVV